MTVPKKLKMGTLQSRSVSHVKLHYTKVKRGPFALTLIRFRSQDLAGAVVQEFN